MEFVIPFVGAGIVVSLVDVAIGVLLIAGIIMILGQLYWLATRTADAVSTFPVIGGVAAGAVRRIIQTTQVLVMSYENVIISNFYWLIRNLRIVLNYYLAPLFIPISNTLEAHFNWLNFLSNDQLPKLWSFIGAMDRTLVAHANWLNFISSDQLPKLWDRATLLAGLIAGHENWLRFITNNQLPALWERLGGIEAGVRDLSAAVLVLSDFLPLLRLLAEFESTTVGGIRTLGADVAGLKQGQADLARDIGKVIPLSVIVAAGLAAVANLERVAKDPCHCLTAGDFSDLPERVSALEELGP